MSRKVAFFTAIIWVLVDYFSKAWAASALREQIIVVHSFLNLRLAYNKGAAFSFLADGGGWQRWVFIAITVIVCLWILYFLLFERLTMLNQLGFGAILGGALGNLFDRILNGSVLDFIQVHYKAYYFPIFNVADTAITVGVILILLSGLFTKKTR